MEENEEKKEYKCPACGKGVKFVSDSKGTLKTIQCVSHKYDKVEKKTIGCQFVVYSKQKLLAPLLLNKEHLKSLVDGETLRFGDLNVFIDVNNPTVIKDKVYYLKIEGDEDIEEVL